MLVGLANNSKCSSRAIKAKKIILKQIINRLENLSVWSIWHSSSHRRTSFGPFFGDSKCSLFQAWFKFGTLLKMIAAIAGNSSGVPNIVTFWIRNLKKDHSLFGTIDDFPVVTFPPCFRSNFFWAGLRIKISRGGGSELVAAGWLDPPLPRRWSKNLKWTSDLEPWVDNLHCIEPREVYTTPQ